MTCRIPKKVSTGSCVWLTSITRYGGCRGNKTCSRIVFFPCSSSPWYQLCFFPSFCCRVRPFLLARLLNEWTVIHSELHSFILFLSSLLLSRSLLSSLFLCPSAANVANPLKHLSGPHWLAILVNCVTLTLSTTFKIERAWHQRKLLMASNFQATESSFRKLSIRKQIVTFPISVNRNATQKQESSISRKVIENSDDKANMQSLWR